MNQGKKRTVLPFEKYNRMVKYYEKCLSNYEKLKSHLEKMLVDFDSLTELDLEEMDDADKYQYLKMKIELDELEGKIDVQRYQLELYQDHIEDYRPKFEMMSAEANKHWDNMIDKAYAYKGENPLSIITVILSGLENLQEEMIQEYKNNVYFSLKEAFTNIEFSKEVNANWFETIVKAREFAKDNPESGIAHILKSIADNGDAELVPNPLDQQEKNRIYQNITDGLKYHEQSEAIS